MLTEHQHRNADKAGYCCHDQCRTACPFATDWLPVHQKHAENVGWNLDGSSDERVDVNVTVQLASVESQSVVY